MIFPQSSMHIDVIVPTWNRPEMLAQALASVQAQTHAQWTCWIAEDGESPATRRAVSPFLADPRFVYLPGPHTGTPAGPRNRAVRQGTGALVAFLDDDDVWRPDKLETQIRCLQAHPACVLVGGNAYRWRGEPIPSPLPLYFSKERRVARAIPYKDMVRRNYMITSSVVARRSALAEAGLFSKAPGLKAGEDFELWLRLGALGEIRRLAEPLLYYREMTNRFYPTLSPEDDYRYKAFVLGLTLVPGSPLDRAANQDKARLVREEIAYCLKGPRRWGRARHRLERMVGR